MEKTMKVARLVEKGVIRFETAEVPKPQKGEVLIKVVRCGICGSDPTIFNGMHPFCPPPVVMGHEFSGTIAELGAGVDSLKVGQRVTILPHLTCGHCARCDEHKSNLCEEVKCIGGQSDGANAEYVCLGAEMVYPISDNMSMDSAAMVEPAAVGYHGAIQAQLTLSDRVLVMGAGTIGNFTMQACKALGARQVFIADYDEWRLSLAQSLGADGTINLNEESVEKGIARLTGDSHTIDAFFECVGGKGTVLDTIISVARRGTRIVMIGIQSTGCYVDRLPFIGEHELTLLGSNMYDAQNYREVIQYMGQGIIKTDGMITHYFDFDDIIKAYDFINTKREKFFKIMLKM